MSISVKTIEAFWQAFWAVNARSKIDAHREEIRAGLEAAMATDGCQYSTDNSIPEHRCAVRCIYSGGIDARIAALEAENQELRSGSYLASAVEDRDRYRAALTTEMVAIEEDRRWADGSDLVRLMKRYEAIAQVLEDKP